VLNLSDQPATVAYDGRALSVAVPAGFIPQVYDRYASSGPRCDPAAGRPNVANCAVSGRPPKVLTLTTLPVSGSFEEVGLVAGCNEVRLTWPVGTPLGIVAAAVAPLGTMESIFKFDPARGRFRGYSPAVPIFLDDYTTVEARLEAVFICTREAGTFTRPQP